MNSNLVNFFQSLQGTIWQERLLFLQQNTETYRWVSFGIFAVVNLILGIVICLISRKKLSMNVSAICFLPGVNLLIVPIGLVGMFFRFVGSMFSGEGKPKKTKVKSSLNSEFSLDSDEGIDLF